MEGRKSYQRGDLITLYVVNLIRSMMNMWLRQLFNSDGNVVDVFLSCEERRATLICLGS